MGNKSVGDHNCQFSVIGNPIKIMPISFMALVLVQQTYKMKETSQRQSIYMALVFFYKLGGVAPLIANPPPLKLHQKEKSILRLKAPASTIRVWRCHEDIFTKDY